MPDTHTEHDSLFIGGRWVGPTSSERITVVNASTEDVLGRCPEGQEADIDAVVEAARNAFDDPNGWSGWTPVERADAMYRLADALEKPVKDWRSAKLFDVGSTQISQIRVATTQGSYTLEKQEGNWKVSEPTSMPADPTVVSDLAMAITSLRAEDFINSANSPELSKRYGLEKPSVSIAFSIAGS